MASTQKNDAASLAQEEKRKKKSTKSTLKNFNSNKKSSLFEKDFNSEISTTPRKSNRYRKFSKSSIQMEHNVRVSSNINIHNQKNRKSLIDKLRILRQDAFDQHLFSTAALWGDKIKNLTDDPNDIYWLAQIYFFMEEYPRVEHLLLKDDLVLKNIRCRILAIQCEIQLEKWQEALDITEIDDTEIKEKKSINIEKGIKLESTLYYLKGLIYSKQNQYDKAKENLKKALFIDVNCYEAFNLLISNYMLTNDEEWELIQSLKYNNSVEGELIKLLYISKMKKYKHLDEINLALERLDKDFYLGSNQDIMLSQANKYYTQSKFTECFELTLKILDNDRFNMECVLLHLVCLYELQKKNELFYIAHQLVEYYPNHEISWFAVGCYYLLIGQSSEARRYFSKSSTICPTFGSAWIGFAHSFAAESEHDQAILAYSTAAKLFQGIHLPAMFIGMQHLQINNNQLAEGFLTVAYNICDSDPTLLNELGVLYYNKKEYRRAIDYFEKTLDIVESVHSKLNNWEITLCNLGHAYRKIRNYEKAKEQFEKVFSLNPSNSQAYSAMAFIYQIEGNLDEAIYNYHSALVLNPEDSFCAEMLKRALEELPNNDITKGVGFKFLDDEVKMEMEQNDVDERHAPPEYELLEQLGFSYLLDNCKDEDVSNIEFKINNSNQNINDNDDVKDMNLEVKSPESNYEVTDIIDDDSLLINDHQNSIFDKFPVNRNYFVSKDYKFPDPNITPKLNNMIDKTTTSNEISSTNPFSDFNDYSIYTPLQNANNSLIFSDASISSTSSSITSYKIKQKQQQQQQQQLQTKQQSTSTESLNKFSLLAKDNLLSNSTITNFDLGETSKSNNNLMNRFNDIDSTEGITPSQIRGRFGASTSFLGKDTSFNESFSIDDSGSPLFNKNILESETPSKQKIINLGFPSSTSSYSSKGESSLKTPIPSRFLDSLSEMKLKYSSPSREGMLTKDKEKGSYIFNQSYLRNYYSLLKNNSTENSTNEDDHAIIINSSPKNGMISSNEEEEEEKEDNDKNENEEEDVNNDNSNKDNEGEVEGESEEEEEEVNKSKEENYYFQKQEQNSTDDEDIDMEMD
jgi:anaphase-promoting complex subunit 6